MNDDYIHPIDAVSYAQLKQSAKAIKTLSEIKDEEADIDAIIMSLEQTMVECYDLSPKSLSDLIAVQARVLDAAFHKEINKVQDDPAHLDQALRLQKQTVRSLVAWKLLKMDVYVRRKAVEFQRLENLRVEQTEQKRQKSDPFAPETSFQDEKF